MSKYLLFISVFLLSIPAFAQCTSPSGAESQTRYSGNKLYYCGGGTWHEVPGGSGGGSGAGCVVGSVYAPDGYTHTFFSAATHSNCASISQSRTCTNGVLSGGAGYSFPSCDTLGDTTPNAFSFNDVTGAPTSTLTYPSPASITIGGINAPASVSVSGQGSPQIRINGGTWVTSGSISDGQTLEVRLTSAAANSTTYTATINVGGVTDSWTVATTGPAPDTTPNAFSFNDVTNAALNTLITPSPATVTIGGINASTPVSVSGTGSPQIRIASGSWVSSGNITNGQTLAVRLTSANANNTARSATINVGGVTDNWSVTTVAADTTPNAFSFNDVTNAALNTLITPSPATITISGINASTPVSVSGTGSPQISINGGGWTTSGNITNGQTLAVRLTSASTNATARSATINVGGVTDNWSVTTVAADTTPNAFNFNDVTNAALNTLTTPSPATITISGINASTPVSVSGTGSPQIRIASGSWVTSGNITNGQTLAVRLTSANTNSTARSATINVGGVTDNWSVTTLAGTANCTLDGVTVNHGSSRMFYTATSVPCGTACSTIGVSRTCTNGNLSGGTTYNKANCTPAACTSSCGTLVVGQWTTESFSPSSATSTQTSAAACKAWCESFSNTHCCHWNPPPQIPMQQDICRRWWTASCKTKWNSDAGYTLIQGAQCTPA